MLDLLDRVSFLLLVEFSALTVSADTLAFFAVASLIAIEGALVEQFGHLICVEVSIGDFVSVAKVALETFFLNQHKLCPEHEQVDGEGGIQWSVLHLMHKFLFAEVLPSHE